MRGRTGSSRLPDARALRERTIGIVFGDRVGVVVFLGALAFFGLYWRVGFFITDSYTIANALANAAEGRLALQDIQYGLTPAAQPGAHEVGGRIYGRNYGHVALGVPFLWLLEGAAMIADLRIVVAGAWSLIVLEFGRHLGAVIDRRRATTLATSALAVGTFVSNVLYATPLSTRWIPLMALQFGTMIAAAFVGVLLYRLLSAVHGRRTGAIGGGAVILSAPIGVWASIPKRHAVTAALALATLYAFYAARTASSERRRRWLRAAAYVPVGLTAWIHPFEAFILFVVLTVVDLTTADSNDRRQLAAIAVAFGVSLVPFLVTNALIGGNPLEPPRMLPTPGDGGNASVEGGMVGGERRAASGASGAGGGTAGSGGAPEPMAEPGDAPPWPTLVPSWVGIPGPVGAVFGQLGTVGRIATAWFANGVSTVINSPERVYHTFVRGGRLPHPGFMYRQVTGYEPVDLAVIEALPVLGALFAASRRWRDGVPSAGAIVTALDRPVRQVDLLAAGYVGLFSLMYMPRLPFLGQITVRYLLPTMPVLVYGICRLSAVRRTFRAPRWLVGGYLATVLGGGAVLWLVLAGIDPSVGEAVQFHALLGLAVAGVLGAWGIAHAASAPDRRLGAVLLGVASGVGTLFVLFGGASYFAYGSFALPVSGLLAEAVRIV